MSKLFRVTIMLMSLCVLSLHGCVGDPNKWVSEVDITKIKADITSIDVDITPRSVEKSLFYAIGSDDDLNAFEAGTLEGIVEENYIESVAKTFSELTPDTEYTVFARCVNSDGFKGNVTTLRISTLPEAGPASATITEGVVGFTTIEVTVTPNENTASFAYAIGTADDIAAFEDGTLEGIVEKSGNEAVTDTFSDLTSNTEYTVFAQCVNADGEKGEVATLKITTLQSGPSSLVAESTALSISEISVTITPNEYTASYSYAIGTAADQAAFEDGTLAGIEIGQGNEEATYSFTELHPFTEYVVFAQSVNGEGVKGDVVVTEAIVLSEEFPDAPYMTVSFGVMNAMYCNATTTPTAAVDHYIVLSAGEDIYEEFVDLYESMGFTEFEFITDMGMECRGEATNLFGLSGQPDFRQMIVTAMIDANGELLGIQKDRFTTPEYNPGLPLPGSMTITVSEETDTTARIIFTPGANTAGYYELVMEAVEYDEIMNNPEHTDQDKIELVRSLMILANNMEIETDDHVWPDLTPSTEYVALARPFNDNGEAGWGEIVSRRFKTLASSGATSTAAPGGVQAKREPKVVRPLTPELLRSLRR